MEFGLNFHLWNYSGYVNQASLRPDLCVVRFSVRMRPLAWLWLTRVMLFGNY